RATGRRGGGGSIPERGRNPRQGGPPGGLAAPRRADGRARGQLRGEDPGRRRGPPAHRRPGDRLRRCARSRDRLLITKADTLKELLDELPEDLERDRKSTRLNSSHQIISYAVFCLKKTNHRQQVK